MVLCVNAERHNIISSFRLCKTYQIYSLRIEGYVDLHGLKTQLQIQQKVAMIEGYVDLHGLKTICFHIAFRVQIEGYVDLPIRIGTSLHR